MKSTIWFAGSAALGIALTILILTGSNDSEKGKLSRLKENSPRNEDSPETEYANVAPDYQGKVIPNLATWMPTQTADLPPTGKHREKEIRIYLKEGLGIDLPASATDFHFAGSFRIPLEDFGPFFDEFLEAAEIDKETLQYTGETADLPYANFRHLAPPDGPKLRFVTARKMNREMMTPHQQLPLSRETISISFVESKTAMKYSFLLDPKTGHGRFLRGPFLD